MIRLLDWLNTGIDASRIPVAIGKEVRGQKKKL
jgi:hypothetical protein